MNVEFVDAKRNKYALEIEIKNGRLSISGDGGGGLGQVRDSIVPATDSQRKLLEIWEKWHLNDLNAGTPRQTKFLDQHADKYTDHNRALEILFHAPREGDEQTFINHRSYNEINNRINDWKRKIVNLNKWWEEEGKAQAASFNLDKSDYYLPKLEEYKQQLEECEDMIKRSLIYDTLPDGTLYRYGSSWLKVDLPEGIEDTIRSIISEIEDERSDMIFVDEDSEEHFELFSDFNDPESAFALAVHCALCTDEIDDIIEHGDCRWTVQGTDYLCGNDEEMDEAWEQSLENYLDECVLPELPENMREYFDKEAWIEDAKVDGRAHSLNRYDGTEASVVTLNSTIYIYRQ